MAWIAFAVTVLFVFIECLAIGESQTGVCYRSETRARTAYRSDGYSDYYSCGFLWLSRCSRTRYRSVSYTAYYTASVFGCCSGYFQCASGSCCAICDEPCQNGGSCVSPNTCICTSAWTNSTCETDVDECEDPSLDNCDHSCANTIGSYNCSCDDGYRLSSDGHTCLDIDECAEGNATCADLCHNTNGTYYCSCSHPGYRLHSDNTSCKNIDECFDDIDGCAQQCTDTDGSYNCSCGSGYTLASDDHGCDDIDECAEDAHNCEQICENTDGSFNCNCIPGYELTSDGITCQDVDECQEDSHTCSQNCHNSVGSYVCTCDEGYVISANASTCIDINECEENNGGCSDTCTNTQGSFICNCNEGFEVDGDYITCIDINECAAGTDLCDQDCTNTVGSYICSCGLGYRMNDNGYQCDEINECEEGTDFCDHECINTNGSYTCQCRSGFRLNGDEISCSDIDECTEGISQCNQLCINTIGSFTCDCISGFIIDVDGRTCDDINECREGEHTCQQVCNNTQGSHHCACFDGYELNVDNYTCRDLNECARNVDECDQNCHNILGSYTCTCNAGYTLSVDEFHCDDVNECAINIHNCTQVCENTPGSYVCSCYDGYTYDIEMNVCNDLNECETGQSECDHMCSNSNGSYTCSCNDGYNLANDGFHCNDIDECSLGPAQCEQVCVNLNGSYSCQCNNGYEIVSGTSRCRDINECDPSINRCEQLCANSDGSFMCDCLQGYSITTDRLSCLGPPINVAINSRTSQSLTFTWQSPVDTNGRHGDFVRSPVVCYSDDNSRQTTIVYSRSADNQVTFEVEALMPYTYYNCCVSVETTIANSTGVCQSTQTPQDVPGTPPIDIVLDVTSSNNISVKWSPPSIPNGVITRFSIYVDYENGTYDVFYVDGQSTSFNITNLLPFQIISVDVSASTVIGEGPHSSQLEIQTAQAPPSEVRSVLITVASNSSITVQWDPPQTPNGILIFYNVLIFNEQTGFNFSMEVPSYDQELSIGRLELFVPYTVQVFASTEAGKSNPVTAIIFTGHGVPAVPSLTSVERLNALSAKVNWIPLTLDDARGILTQLDIAYEPVRAKDCTEFYPDDSAVLYITENLFEQSTAIIGGLEPDKEYCVAIKISTIGGESGFSNSLIIPLSTRVAFQIRFILNDDEECSTLVNNARAFSDITSAIANAVSQQCQCQFTASLILNSRLFCGDESKPELIFGGLIATPENITANEIRNLTQDWVLTKPHISIADKMYQVDPYCSIAVDNIGDSSCEAISPTESEPDSTSPRFTLLEIISVAVMALLLIIVLLSCTIIFCLIRRLHKSRIEGKSSVEFVASQHAENIYDVPLSADNNTFDFLSESCKTATTNIDNEFSDDCTEYKL